MEQWAHYYVSKGLAVFPLLPRDKKPATAHGFKDATTDQTTITAWWTQNPDYNIGIATGAASGGLVVIDLDINQDKGYDGRETLRDWEASNGILPETWMSITGRGGYHLFYHDCATNSNRTGLYEGVDIRGDGGYIVAPPSIHPNGRRYEWEQSPEEFALSDTDSVVACFLMGPPAGGMAKAYKTPDEIPEGGRNAELYRLACSMQARGDAPEAIRAAVEATNESRCIPPLDQGEINTLLKSAGRHESGTAPYRVTASNGVMKPMKAEVVTFSDAVDSAAYETIDFKPLVWIIKGILPNAGLAGVYAKPKVGKTWFCYELAFAIATGGVFLGTQQIKGDVVYYDLETTGRNRQKRLKKMSRDGPIPSGIKFISEVGTLGHGFEEDLAYRLKQFPNTRVAIVDTIKKIRNPVPQGLSENQHDDAEIGRLAKFANDHNILIVAVSHNKKAAEEDPFDSALGSISIIGSLDAVLVFTQSRGENGEVTGTTLHVKGREVEEEHYKMDFQDCRWSIVGKAEDVDIMKARNDFMNNPITKAVLAILKPENGMEWKGKAKEFIDEAARHGIDLTRFSSQSVTTQMKAMEGQFIMYCGIEHKEIKHKGNSTIHHFYSTAIKFEGFEAL
ncbi:MAG: bifunctional DNA primase/polymerase [Eubacterium sp.]